MRAELIKFGAQVLTLLITAIIAPAVMSWLTQKAEDAKLARIKEWALKAVMAAEQIYKDYERRDPDGQKRRGYAFATLKRINQKCGFGLSDQEISMMIEAAVHELQSVESKRENLPAA